MPLAQVLLNAVVGPLVLAGAGLCLLGAGLAQLGRRSAAWDVLTNLAPGYLAGGALSLATASILRDGERALALVLGAGAVIAAGLLMAPEFLSSPARRASAAGPGAFKLIQFNIKNGEGGIDRPAAWLAAQRPDVVVVQETNRRVRAAISERTGLHLTLAHGSVALFSREPPVSLLPRQKVAESPTLLVGARFRTALGEALVLGVHYPWPTEFDRLAQTADLVRLVRALPAETTILSGDFNSTPWSFTRRREDRELGLIRRTRAVFSWPAWRGLPFPLLPIDHVYAGSAWATVSVRRGPKLGSDHYPIVVILAPQARGGA